MSTSPAFTLLPSMIQIFYYAHGKASEVIVFAFVHARHFGSFAAHQGTACEFTASTDTGDNGCRSVDV